MPQERMKVLEMLAEGKISPEDANRLLQRLESLESDDEEMTGEDEAEDRSKGRRLRWLRVVVNEKSGEKVNIRIPLAFVRAGLKLTSVMPHAARKKLEESGVDLGRLGNADGKELIEALRELNIEVDEPNGEQVRIYCE